MFKIIKICFGTKVFLLQGIYHKKHAVQQNKDVMQSRNEPFRKTTSRRNISTCNKETEVGITCHLFLPQKSYQKIKVNQGPENLTANL